MPAPGDGANNDTGGTAGAGAGGSSGGPGYGSEHAGLGTNQQDPAYGASNADHAVAIGEYGNGGFGVDPQSFASPEDIAEGFGRVVGRKLQNYGDSAYN